MERKGRHFRFLMLLKPECQFKEVSKGLQSWSDKKIRHINSQLVLVREILHQLEIAQDARVLAAGEIWLKNNLKKHCLALASL